MCVGGARERERVRWSLCTVQCFLAGVHRIAGRMLGRSDQATTAAVHHRRTACTAHVVRCIENADEAGS